MANQQELKNAKPAPSDPSFEDIALIRDPGIWEFGRRAGPPQPPVGDGPPRKWELPKSESTPANRKQSDENDDQDNPEGSLIPTSRDRRLIEDWLPVNELSVEAVREGGALAGHPPVNQLHVWWARRPLVVSRATVAASLLNADADRSQFIRAIGSTDTVVAERRRMDEIKATGQWSNIAFSNKRAFTHNLTQVERQWFHDNLAGDSTDPVVLDITAGGGSIPFEAGRLGLRSHANELNPVAGIILHATCRWPQEYGNSLRAEYDAVSARFRGRVAELLAGVYPAVPQPGGDGDADAADGNTDAAAGNPENKNSRIVRAQRYVWAYLWARTIDCYECGREVPLSPNWRLSGKGDGVRLWPDEGKGVCDFEMVKRAAEQSEGTVRQGIARCPYPSCRAASPKGYLAEQARAGRMGHRLYCVIYTNKWQHWQNGQWVDIRRPKEFAHIPNPGVPCGACGG